MTREDIHEAAKNDDADGQKPGGAGEISEGGSGFGTDSETNVVNGADAVPDKTTGGTSPRTPNQ